jgi:hypothetical protein
VDQSAFSPRLTEIPKIEMMQTTLSYRNKAFVSRTAQFNHVVLEMLSIGFCEDYAILKCQGKILMHKDGTELNQFK